ncbi:MAG: hypothetical protein CMF62_03455 [Magnetococcales bacterium]|nr:hypothetical protein [Magnetococcales bacterium]|tara:strand:- start:3628 stop:5202 length:1575 start_codon:yes stop_codon:yes gene_type:complete
MEKISYTGAGISNEFKKDTSKFNMPIPMMGSSIFDQVILQVKMQIKDWFMNKYQITNPILLLFLTYVIIYPEKTYYDIRSLMTNIYLFLKYISMILVSLVLRKPTPKKNTFNIPYIVENKINHLYFAFDWYIKSKSKKVYEKDYHIVSIENPIEANKDECHYDLMKSQPNQTISEFEFNGKVINYKKSNEKVEVYTPSGPQNKTNYILTLWSYELSNNDFDSFSQLVANEYAKSKIDSVWEQKMFTNCQGEWASESLKRNKRRAKTVVLDDDLNLKLLEDIEHFNNSEDWYLERGIPYKKSYLFYGPPGTGKTSLIKALSYEIQRHIHFLSLSTVKNDEELNKLISDVNFKETIIVLEDIDCMSQAVWDRDLLDKQNTEKAEKTDKKKNKDKEFEEDEDEKNKVTLSAILNAIDGIRNNHGMILVMTTNHPERLDEALIRDGRVDERLLFNYCTNEQIYKIFKNFYNGELELTLQDFQKLELDQRKLAPCNVEVALKKYYKDQHQAYEFLVNYNPTEHKKEFHF